MSIKLPTFEFCENNEVTKGALAEQLYGHITVDLSIPEGLARKLYGGSPCGVWEYVMGYPASSTFGILLPLTQEAAIKLRKLAPEGSSLDQLMTWATVGLVFEVDENGKHEFVIDLDRILETA